MNVLDEAYERLLADAVADAFERTGDPTVVAAGQQSLDLIPAETLAR
jgi:hypothetical protein